MLTPRDFPPPPEDEELSWCQFGLPGPETLKFRDRIRVVLREHSADFGGCKIAVDAGCGIILVTLYPRHAITESIVIKLNAILRTFEDASSRIELYQDDTRP